MTALTGRMYSVPTPAPRDNARDVLTVRVLTPALRNSVRDGYEGYSDGVLLPMLQLLPRRGVSGT